MKCDKCGSTSIEIKRDQRGLPIAYCAACGEMVKRMSTSDVLDYYEGMTSIRHEDKKPCQYCKEKYIMVRGNERTRQIRVFLDNKYCPMCGRELRADDLRY